MNLRIKGLFDGWVVVARMVYKRHKLIEGKNLPHDLIIGWIKKLDKITNNL